MKYHLTVNEEQLRIIHDSLDLYSRILIGQYEEAGKLGLDYSVNMLDNENPYNPKPEKHEYKLHHVFSDMIREAKVILGFDRNGSYGIHSEHVHENARNSYDIVQVIRNYLANKNYKEGDSRIGVSFDTPHQTGEYEMPEIQDAPEAMI